MEGAEANTGANQGADGATTLEPVTVTATPSSGGAAGSGGATNSGSGNSGGSANTSASEDGKCESFPMNKAVTDAGARAYYACKYFQAVEKNANVNLAIAGIQQVAAFYFANKQRESAKETTSRLDDMWSHQKDQSSKLFGHWYDNGRQEELEQLKKASDREENGYTPDYETAKNRVLADVRGEFGLAREKMRRERKAHCVGAFRHAELKLNIAEARAAVAALNQAYRAEEQRKDLKEAQYREELYKWLSLFRGVVGDSLNAGRMAVATAAARGSINKYEQWQQAFGGLSNLGNAYGAYNTAGVYSSGGLGAVYADLFGHGTGVSGRSYGVSDIGSRVINPIVDNGGV